MTTTTLKTPHVVLHPVKSSFITAMGHQGNTLTVEYANGALYAFDGVSPELYDEVRNAKSVGQAYNSHIRGKLEAKAIPQHG